MRRLLPLLALSFALGGPLLAALNPNAVSLWVTSSEKLSTRITAKRSDGTRDKETTRIERLDIECRPVGVQRPEPATIEWLFISKDTLNGKFFYHSRGSKDVTIPMAGVLKLAAISEPSTDDRYLETSGIFRTQVTVSDAPAGWVVRIKQGGQFVHTVREFGSTPEMVAWAAKNPPPKDS